MERLERDFFRTIKILVEIMGDDFWIFKSVSELKLLKYCNLYGMSHSLKMFTCSYLSPIQYIGYTV